MSLQVFLYKLADSVMRLLYRSSSQLHPGIDSSQHEGFTEQLQ